MFPTKRVSAGVVAAPLLATSLIAMQPSRTALCDGIADRVRKVDRATRADSKEERARHAVDRRAAVHSVADRDSIR